MRRAVVFRFCVLYLTLYAFATQVAGGVFLVPGAQLPAVGTLWPLRDVIEWLGPKLVGAPTPFVPGGSSGDTAFHWSQLVVLLVVAAAGTAIWTAIDPRPREERARSQRLRAWFRLFVRFALAAQMFYYGMAKVIPTQFQRPSLVTLVERVGNLSLSELLWTFIGASTPYQIFTGAAELIAGLLLIVPQTTPLGALIALADMIQVFALNASYDFGLKMIAFHLILMSLFLLWPDLQRLANVLVLDRPAPASSHPPLFRTATRQRAALAAQIVFGLYLLVMFTNLSLRYWYSQGDGRPRSPLYGIWDVRALTVDGVTREPALNDYDRRWKRVIFDTQDVVVIQRTDDSFAHYGLGAGSSAHHLDLWKGRSRSWQSTFTVSRPSPEQLVLEGQMDGHQIRSELTLLPLDTFELLGSSFRWIRP